MKIIGADIFIFKTWEPLLNICYILEGKTCNNTFE